MAGLALVRLVEEIILGKVRELRLVITTEDYEAALAFWRDALGMDEQLAVNSPDGRVAILDAGRATLEIADANQARFIDQMEVGRPGVSGQFRVALQVGDVMSTTAELAAKGAAVLGEPRKTPFRSINSRLVAPDGVQLTLFEMD